MTAVDFALPLLGVTAVRAVGRGEDCEAEMSAYYDRQGKPMAMLDWAEALSDINNKRVAEATLPNGYWISTVWLGIDHSFGHGLPLIFETMVFPHNKQDDGGKGVTNWGELDSKRYSTEEEALEGHARMVETWGRHD